MFLKCLYLINVMPIDLRNPKSFHFLPCSDRIMQNDNRLKLVTVKEIVHLGDEVDWLRVTFIKHDALL